MKKYPEAVIVELCQHLEIERGFFVQCLEESEIEIHEVEGRWDLDGGTALRLRRLQRICDTFDVELPAAKLILDLSERIAGLEEEVYALRIARGKL
jgi:hypothetical protein